MKSWDVFYDKKIEKNFTKMRPNVKRAFAQALIDLAEEGPYPEGWDVVRLQGKPGEVLRLKLDYRHRLIYQVFRTIIRIELLELATRENAY